MFCKSRSLSARTAIVAVSAAGTALLALAPASAVHAQDALLTLPTVNGNVRSFAISGTTLYIGGDFTTVGGVARTGLAAIDLTTDTLVTGFNPTITDVNHGGYVSVESLAVTTTGALWASGDFTTVGGSARNDIAQFASTGSLNSVTVANNASQYGGIEAITLDSSNNIFSVSDGTYFGSSTVTNTSGLLEASSTGAAVSSFAPSTSGSLATAFRGFAVSPDGSKLYLGLNSSGLQFNGTSYSSALQLNTGNGAASYDFNSSGQTFGTKVIGNNLYFTGSFTTIGPSSTADNNIARFNVSNSASPTLDTTFAAGTVAHPSSSDIRAVTQVGSNLYLLGEFTTYDGVANNGLVEVNSADASIVNSFSVTASQNFGGSGIGIAGYAGGSGAPASIFTQTGVGGNGATVTVAGSSGAAQTEPYFVGLTVPAGTASAPEPSAFALLASAAGLPILGAASRRRRSVRMS